MMTFGENDAILNSTSFKNTIFNSDFESAAYQLLDSK